ncbi:MAG: RagB/SusD family nutrient uptake outer membrane protein [Bacteroidales bacterium]|nr:RagB/SusD family nutrient uptake outer membrane protein [Bacteroidales bacterium]
MKRITSHIIIGCVAGLAFTSCNDSFMQQDPMQELAEGSFLVNEGDLPLYLNQLYDSYIDGHGRGFAYDAQPPLGTRGSYIIYADMATDNAVAFTNTTGNIDSRLNGTFVTPTDGTSTGWEWKKLRAVNYFLHHYREAAGSVVDPAKLNRWAAEAFFFKAMDYYRKLYIFGEVPWYTLDMNIDSEGLYAPRTPRVALVDSIMWCIDYAVQNLPETGKSNDRLNRDMANFLKARFCLFEGTFRKYHTELGLQGTAGRFLEAAEKACEAVMASSRQYELYQTGSDPYWYMFRLNRTPEADGNREAILARTYDGLKLGHGTSRYFNMNRGNAAGRYSKGATRGLVDEYLCMDGRPIYTGGTEGAYAVNPLFKGYDGDDWRELDNRDPRLKQTVVKPGEYITVFDRETGLISQAANGLKYPEITCNCPTANQTPTGGPTVTGYMLIKHWTPDVADNGTTTMSKQTALVFRYGEILLILAEAKAELGTITNSDLDRTVNRLRQRAGFDFTAYPGSRLTLQNIPADPRLDQIYAERLHYPVSPLLREIRRERRVEMAMEGLRREDLVRWKAGKLMEVPMRGMKFTAEKQKLYDGTNTGKAKNAPKAILNDDVFVDSEGFIIGYPKSPEISNGTLKWEDRYYYWPIPLRELKLNANLTQSPGWTAQ